MAYSFTSRSLPSIAPRAGHGRRGGAGSLAISLLCIRRDGTGLEELTDGSIHSGFRSYAADGKQRILDGASPSEVRALFEVLNPPDLDRPPADQLARLRARYRLVDREHRADPSEVVGCILLIYLHRLRLDDAPASGRVPELWRRLDDVPRWHPGGHHTLWLGADRVVAQDGAAVQAEASLAELLARLSHDPGPHDAALPETTLALRRADGSIAADLAIERLDVSVSRDAPPQAVRLIGIITWRTSGAPRE